MDKGMYWFYSILMFSLFFWFSVNDYTKSKTEIEATKAGLEECPNVLGFKKDTVWVRDCVKFLEQAKEGKEGKE